MTKQENLEFIRTHIAAFGKGEINTLLQQCTPDVIWTPPISHGVIPYNQPWRGREGVREYLSLLFGALEWSSFEIVALLAAQENHVIFLGKESFKVRTTGNIVDNNVFLALFKIRDGMIAEFTLCENTELVAAAFLPSAVDTSK